MKNKRIFLLVAIISLATNLLQSQNYMIEKFHLAATDMDYGVYANVAFSAPYAVYFDMDAPNPQQRVQAYLAFTFKKNAYSEMEAFIKSLQDAYQKYSEWKNLAKNYSFKYFSKTIPVPLSDKTLYFTEDGKWFMERGVDMKYKFFVDSNGDCYLIMESDYMTSTETVSESYAFTSSYNAYLNVLGLGFRKSEVNIERYCGGASLIFSSESEINGFINTLRKVANRMRYNWENGQIFK